MNRVTGPGLPTGAGSSFGAFYTYDPNSDLVGRTEIRNDQGTALVRAQRAYEAQRDLVDYVENTWRPGSPNAATLSKYDYTNNSVGLRTNVAYSGVAFNSPNPAIGQSFGYNKRSELTNSARSDPNAAWAYGYDPIGNRTTSVQNTGTARTTTYYANAKNQYYWAQTNTSPPTAQGMQYDADGNLVEFFVAADMDCNGVAGLSDIDCFVKSINNCPGINNEPNYPCGTCDCLNGDMNGDGHVGFADIDAFVSLMGSSSTGVRAVLVWDGENRLIESRPVALTTGAKKVAFRYDYLGRRVEKRVYAYSGDPNNPWPANPTEVRRFVWGGQNATGWLLLAEYDGLASNALARSYSWGLDLAGQSGAAVPPVSDRWLEGAGGIGGLLAVHDPNNPNDPNDPFGDFVYTYDANGNVGQVVNWSADPNAPAAALVAKYQYDPYGNRINYDPNAPDLYDQPFRFSTKQFDAETGLIYFGMRYYDPRTGRWTNRDPIAERGGVNLYAAFYNRPVSALDYLGLWTREGVAHVLCCSPWRWVVTDCLARRTVHKYSTITETAKKWERNPDGSRGRYIQEVRWTILGLFDGGIWLQDNSDLVAAATAVHECSHAHLSEYHARGDTVEQEIAVRVNEELFRIAQGMDSSQPGFRKTIKICSLNVIIPDVDAITRWVRREYDDQSVKPQFIYTDEKMDYGDASVVSGWSCPQ